MEEFWKQVHLAAGYQFVYTPHIAKARSAAGVLAGGAPGDSGMPACTSGSPALARVSRATENHLAHRRPHRADRSIFPRQADLWRTSGHLDFYRESMYGQVAVEDELYQLKPMNCPGHVAVYRAQQTSYRDLPRRWAELGTVYRYERSGTMHGLFRVRGFTQVCCCPGAQKGGGWYC